MPRLTNASTLSVLSGALLCVGIWMWTPPTGVPDPVSTPSRSLPVWGATPQPPTAHGDRCQRRWTYQPDPLPWRVASSDPHFPIQLVVPWGRATGRRRQPDPCSASPNCHLVYRNDESIQRHDGHRVYVVDSLSKRAEDERYLQGQPSGGIQVIWGHENWCGRMREWDSKYKGRWLNRTADIKFWSQFHLSVSIEQSSDVQFLYAQEFPHLLGVGDVLKANGIPLASAVGALGMAAYIASNCHTWYGHVSPWSDVVNLTSTWPSKHRDQTVKALQAAGLSVNSFGSCLRNKVMATVAAAARCRQVPTTAASPSSPLAMTKHHTKFCVIRQHFFYLAFENSRYPDYVTEKVYEALAVGTVPVYLGAPNVGRYLPAPHAVIRASDFATPSDLVAYLHCVARNQTVLAYYRDWESRKPEIIGLSNSTVCRLCALLSRLDLEKLKGRQVVPPAPTQPTVEFHDDTQSPIPCS